MEVMALCDCPICPCWYRAWEEDGESRCFDCANGKHHYFDDSPAT